MSKILLIDDDEDFASTLKEMIEVLGKYRIVVAIGSKAGLKAASKEIPDLILLDVEMPGMSGHEVLKKLNKKNKTKDIPVIMVSGLKTEDSISKSYQEFAEQYIYKPVDPDVLKEAIERTLSHHS